MNYVALRCATLGLGEPHCAGHAGLSVRCCQRGLFFGSLKCLEGRVVPGYCASVIAECN